MKRIGIVAWATTSNSFGITIPYAAFFSKFGVVEMIMPNEVEARDVDLLVIPGGPDVDTKRYLTSKEPLSYFIGKPCPFRERFDNVLLPQYIDKGTKIFGICRGLQSLAVTFGGKLIQDLAEYGHVHSTNPENDRKKLVHDTKVDMIVCQRLGIQTPAKFKINSIHHQAVSHEDLPEIATVLAWNDSKDEYDQTIEAVTFEPHYPIYGVQWHPEEIEDEFSINIINKLLNN